VPFATEGRTQVMFGGKGGGTTTTYKSMTARPDQRKKAPTSDPQRLFKWGLNRLKGWSPRKLGRGNSPSADIVWKRILTQGERG